LAGIREVDAKLVRLAKILDCQIVTNDFNLNKVAKIENVKVLNINDLSGALRPVVFPGEYMKVLIKKEGKEKNQGVGFLDDGTMIVVDDARKYIGKAIKVTVTSVLQTSAGRMIFASCDEPKQKNRGGRSSKRSGRSNNRRDRSPDRDQK
ncbi:MAG: TRAM domain-containing protein, partial [Candidatus Omnitrophica bacterium]|nr:TRAM domain-containing protein [Candidatus Omnitrophota bacterium]